MLISIYFGPLFVHVKILLGALTISALRSLQLQQQAAVDKDYDYNGSSLHEKVDLERIDRHGVFPSEPSNQDDNSSNGEAQYCAEETSLKWIGIRIRMKVG